MTLIAAKPAQLKAHVAQEVARRPHDQVYGVHYPAPWSGEDRIEVQGRHLPIVHCASVLAVCEALSRHEGQPFVLLCALSETVLPLDVRARLAGRSLSRPNVWELVQELFRARDTDHRLRSHGWLADALLNLAPSGGYPPATAGYLDADAAWRQVMEQGLGLPTASPAAVELLSWSVHPASAGRLAAWPADGLAALRERWALSAGALGATVFDLAAKGHLDLILPIGLLCDLLFDPSLEGQPLIAQAIVRLEPYFDDETLTPALGRAWAAAARSAYTGLAADQRHLITERTERLMKDIKAAGFAAASPVLPIGLRARLQEASERLSDWLEGRGSLTALQSAVTRAQAHDLAASAPDRLERLTMALRLVRLAETQDLQSAPWSSLAKAIEAYARHGAYVDWACERLAEGDDDQALAAAYGALRRRIRTDRETQNRRFAELLQGWQAVPDAGPGLLPIEQVLDTVVVPAATTSPVLVLVMDGMSLGVYRELSDSLANAGWCSLAPAGQALPPAAISMVPTVTEYARTSLLVGRAARGGSADEKKGFAAHAGLRALSAAVAPVLFHKGDLSEGDQTGLAEAVRAAIADKRRRVVAVVVNAIDDHLAKTEQLTMRWSIGTIGPLAALLAEARLAGRLVVLTADHGHVREAGSTMLPGAESGRWRPAGPEPGPQEISMGGPRLQATMGQSSVIVPWSESVRYGAKHCGYHGGATPQEVLVPIGVWASVDRLLSGNRESAMPGWEESADLRPVWWEGDVLPRAPVPAPTVKPAKKPDVAKQPTLFDPITESQSPDWVATLLASEVFAAQRRLASKVVLDDGMIRMALEGLHGHGSTLPRRMLASACGLGELRLRGFLTTLQRILNVEGYPVLVVDETTGLVTLDLPLLRRQFGLPQGGP